MNPIFSGSLCGQHQLNEREARGRGRRWLQDHSCPKCRASTLLSVLDLKSALIEKRYLDTSVLDLLLQNLSGPINSGLHSLHADAEKLRALLLRTAFNREQQQRSAQIVRKFLDCLL